MNLIQKAPETLNLAVMLTQHVNNKFNIDVVELIGRLKRHGEAAVPPLVEIFLEEWKAMEQPVFIQKLAFNRVSSKCLSIVKAIGEIGGGKNGYQLLRELCLISPPRSYLQQGSTEAALVQLAEQALKKLPPRMESEKPSSLFDDKTLISGHWEMRSVMPYQEIKGELILKDRWIRIQMRIKDGPLFGSEAIGNFNCLPRYQIDETKTPKQISLTMDGTLQRQFGLYELTETSLRIQLAKIGEPRPLELVADKTKLPEGQLLLELGRGLSLASDKTAETE
jgi:hypothetical protein